MRMSTHPHSCKLGIQLTPSIDLRNIFFRKWLNNFAKIGDRSRLRFLRTTTWILSRPVAFVESRLFINLETSLSQKHIAKFVFHWWGGESGRGWPLSSSAELEAKFITKIFALSVENLIWNFPELVESVSFQLCLCIAMVSILQNSCALIADSSESSKWFCYTAPSDCSNGNRAGLEVGQGWLFGHCFHAWKGRLSEKLYFLKNAVRGALVLYYLKLSQLASVHCSMKWDIEDSVLFGISFDIDPWVVCGAQGR